MDMKKKDIILCVTFALLLVGGLVLCLFLPKSSYSDSERRMLSPMPELFGGKCVERPLHV